MARLAVAEGDNTRRKRQIYRPVKALPHELRAHCVIFFEEGLYSQALTLLSNVLVSGTTPTHDIPAFIPSLQCLSLLVTLIIHPSLTTKAKSPDAEAAANQALHFLRSLNTIVGPVSANFAKAFVFMEKSGLRSKRSNNWRQNSPSERESSSPGSDDEEEIKHPLATEKSLWVRADDFWHAVGWSFKCSVQYKARWERWKLWLGLMLDVIEDDVRERARLIEEDPSQAQSIAQDCLIVQYLGEDARFGRNERRKIMRAVLAKGSDKEVAEFRPVFAGETEERKTKEQGLNPIRKKIDLDEGEFGDYYDSDEDEEMEPQKEMKEEPGLRTSTRISRTGIRSPTSFDVDGDVDMEEEVHHTDPSEVDPVEAYGGTESLLLRRRILVLLTAVSVALPNHFPDLEDWFDIYTEFFHHLPLSVFITFISAIGPHAFPPAIHSSFLKMLLRPIIANAAPRHEDAYMTQEILERYYLPYAANTSNMVTNAKVSIILETLLRLLKDHASLVPTEALKQAVAKGVQARNAKATPDARRKWGKGAEKARVEEAEAGLWLRTGALRLEMMVEMLEARAHGTEG